MPRRNQPEEQLQRTVVEYLRWTKPNCVWFFVNNGARLSKAQAGIAKAMGVLAGVGDLVFIFKDDEEYTRAWVGFIELKADDNDLSAVQEDFAEAIMECGALYEVCRSIEDVERTLKSWHVTFAHDRGRAA